ncbi:MAG: flagellar basal-body rod protein FlgG [Gemmatimonadaceae bacterium]
MNPALRIAATGMAAQQKRTEVIANNLANVNTTAFKRSRASFEDLLYQAVREVQVVGNTDAETVSAIQIGRGTRLAAVNRINEQGALEQTGRPLDVAVEGEGLFAVRLNTGQQVYTRDGAFEISDQGVLVTKEGHTVEPGIRIPDGAGNLSIGRTGVVSVTRSTGEIIDVGRIMLHRFTNPSGLFALGENLYAETPASGAPMPGNPEDEGFGRIVQGYVEASNVEIVQEMVDMISSQRAYEINSKSVKAADEMSEVATQLIR